MATTAGLSGGLVVLALGLAACGSSSPAAAPAAGAPAPTASGASGASGAGTTSTTVAPTTTTTTYAPGTAPAGPTTSPPLPAPGPGFVAGHVTAVGDSVMIDYQNELEKDIPGVTVEAGVSRQWSEGEALLSQLKSAGQLGAVVIVGLGTNGPITDSDFDQMMSVLSGASRVVFVNIVVGQPWGTPNNAVLASGVSRYPNAVLADWAGLETQNPGWVYSDGTHLPIDGAGATVLANLIASKA